jgi:hypothetical protein
MGESEGLCLYIYMKYLTTNIKHEYPYATYIQKFGSDQGSQNSEGLCLYVHEHM